MHSCWVIYNGSLTSDKFKDQARVVERSGGMRRYSSRTKEKL